MERPANCHLTPRRCSGTLGQAGGLAFGVSGHRLVCVSASEDETASIAQIARAVIVYESMFGNTHAIADAIAKGLASLGNVVVVPVVEGDRERLGDVDLLVVGGPTHFRGMSRPRSRKWAAATAEKPKKDLVLDRDAQGPGVRDWLTSLGDGDTKVAAFDTRFKGPAVLRGRASKMISRRLRRHGFEVVAKPESFFVTLENHLEPGEEARAQEWGKRLAANLVSNGMANADRLGRQSTSEET